MRQVTAVSEVDTHVMRNCNRWFGHDGDWRLHESWSVLRRECIRMAAENVQLKEGESVGRFGEGSKEARYPSKDLTRR